MQGTLFAGCDAYHMPIPMAAHEAVIKQTAKNAEAVAKDFRQRARQFILDYLGRHGPSSGEVITAAAIESGLVPHDQRAFGGIYLGLSKRKKIVKVGTCVRKKGHGTGGGVIWSLVKAE